MVSLTRRRKVALFFFCYATTIIITNIPVKMSQDTVPKSYYENILRQSLVNGSTVEVVKHKIASLLKTKHLEGCDVVVEAQHLDLQLVVNISGSIKCVIEVTTTIAQTVRFLHQPFSFLFESIDNNQKAVDRAIAKHRHGDDQYFNTISKFPQILTVLIAWPSYTKNQFQVANLPVKQYYLRSMPSALCLDSSEIPECRDNLNPNIVFASTLNLSMSYKKSMDMNESETKAQDQSIKLNVDESQKTKRKKFPIFYHVVHNGYIDENGRIASGPLDISAHQCKVEKPTIRSDSLWYFFIPFHHRDIPVHDEVFVISQYWGSGFFHSAIESLPRIAPYLDFLLANPQIFIHAKSTFPHFAALGIPPHRIIHGRVKARTVYVPQGGGCGWLNPAPGQLLSQRYHAYARQTFDEQQLQRNAVVLIQRSTKRYLQQHNEIAAILSDLVEEFGGVLKIFGDNPVPEFDAIVQTFYSARLVVAPHGAGLANLMFSQPGTGVIEVLCNPDPNFCYHSVARALGHPYIGLLSTKPQECGPLYVDIPYFKKVARNFIANMKEHQDKMISSNTL